MPGLHISVEGPGGVLSHPFLDCVVDRLPVCSSHFISAFPLEEPEVVPVAFFLLEEFLDACANP